MNKKPQEQHETIIKTCLLVIKIKIIAKSIKVGGYRIGLNNNPHAI
jgi:hypothetical protein